MAFDKSGFLNRGSCAETHILQGLVSRSFVTELRQSNLPGSALISWHLDTFLFIPAFFLSLCSDICVAISVAGESFKQIPASLVKGRNKLVSYLEV
jgi:hypothetical protein